MITQWYCGAHKADVPLDHFAKGCTYCHPDFAAAILADRELQAEREGVRVSSASGCPRKYAILAADDVAVDPLSYLQAMKGTAWHSLMETGIRHRDVLADTLQANPDVYNYLMDDKAERPSSVTVVGAEISVTGTIADIPTTGTIDRVLLRSGQLIGQDHKTGKDAREPFIRGGKSFGKVVEGKGAPMEYKVQLSLYAHLYEQQFGRAWDGAEIWWTLANHWCEPITILSVDECLVHHPYDSEFTVLDLLQQAQQVADGAVQWGDLPLVGKNFQFGKMSGCDYCEVKAKCWESAFGAPF